MSADRGAEGVRREQTQSPGRRQRPGPDSEPSSGWSPGWGREPASAVEQVCARGAPVGALRAGVRHACSSASTGTAPRRSVVLMGAAPASVGSRTPGGSPGTPSTSPQFPSPEPGHGAVGVLAVVSRRVPLIPPRLAQPPGWLPGRGFSEVRRRSWLWGPRAMASRVPAVAGDQGRG